MPVTQLSPNSACMATSHSGTCKHWKDSWLPGDTMADDGLTNWLYESASTALVHAGHSECTLQRQSKAVRLQHICTVRLCSC